MRTRHRLRQFGRAGRVRLGVVRRRFVARREHDPGHAVTAQDRDRLLVALDAPHPGPATGRRADIARRVALAHLAIGSPRRCARSLARALTRSPDDGASLAVAARLATEIGPDEITLDQHLGLVRRPGRDEPLLESVLARAARNETDPRCLRLIAEHGRAVGLDAAEAAERAVQVDPADAHGWYLLGRARVDAAYDHGGQTAAVMDAIRDAFHAALDRRPHDARSRFHLVRSYVSTGEWAAAYAVSAPDAEPDDRTDVLAGLAGSGEELATRHPRIAPDSWYVIHAEALAAGRVRAAAVAKDALAACTLARTGPYRVAGLGPSLGVVRALVHLGRLDDADRQLDALRGESLPHREALAVARLADDLAFRAGRADCLRWPAANATVDPEAEERFRTLIEGRTVAVVGPSATGARDGAEIDDHDVVIRTKHIPGRIERDVANHGERTDVSYYTDSSARLFQEEIGAAIRDGEIELAVLRPSAFRASRWTAGEGRVRLSPAEDSLPFQGTHFAIQRIIYDLLHYAPTRISLFHLDFFTGDSTYLPGYATEATEVFEPNQLRPIVSTAMHDLREDFRFTRMLARRGLVTASPSVETILQMGTDEYLRTVESGAASADSTERFVR